MHEFESRLGYPLGLGEQVSVNNEILHRRRKWLAVLLRTISLHPSNRCECVCVCARAMAPAASSILSTSELAMVEVRFCLHIPGAWVARLKQLSLGSGLACAGECARCNSCPTYSI